jgi:hypothetical protein
MLIIRLESNKPRQITLKYKSAKEKQGRSGMEYLYTLDKKRVPFESCFATMRKDAGRELFHAMQERRLRDAS